jgi:acyl dehydratase
MKELTIAELEQSAGTELGVSEWHALDQRTIDLFADATGDHQWIHVDPERAADGPFGGTVAHGYLTLSTLPLLLSEVVNVSDAAVRINYGINRIRFTSPVRAGSRIRLHAKVNTVERRGAGIAYVLGVEVEIEGGKQPALVGEIVALAYAEGGN